MPENPVNENKPYRGHLSYQEEDDWVFFGRKRQADELLAKVLASPFSVLHAQSGAGKTSLLNALVIPGLQKRGWTVAIARPQFDPSVALRHAAIQQILPPPAAEAEALDQALRNLFPGQQQVALQSILDQFDLLPLRDDRRRALLEPIADSRPGAKGHVRPLFFRLLRAAMEVRQYGEHIQALFQSEPAQPPDDPLDNRVDAGALLEFLRQPRLAEAHAGLVADLTREGSTLRAFIEQLVARYGRRRRGFGLVLIMDQFEELFTRFTANAPAAGGNPGEVVGSASLPSWRLRLAFFRELEELWAVIPKLPVHLVISMRDEFIAQLDPLRRFVRELDSASYHLTFLEKEDARDCVSKPARLFGYDYDDEVYASIFGALVREDRFIEPSQLQIVCEKLWVVIGRTLAQAGQAQSAEPMLIRMDALPKGGAREILDNFFAEYLDELDATPGGRYRTEALEILDALVMVETGTRNIVERRVLMNAPFRDPQHRALVLDSLAAKRIVRLEQRLGGEFAEITHEFLIPSIRQRITVELNGDNNYADFRWALRSVMRYKDVDFRSGTESLLSKPAFQILHRERQRIFMGTSPTEEILPELMVRSALSLRAEREALEYWIEEVGKHDSRPTVSEILSPARLADPSRKLLALWELCIVNQYSRSAALSYEQSVFVLRSQIERGTLAERDAVLFWTRRVYGAESERISDR